MQRCGCNYCRIGLKRLTKGSPRNNYRYCPMCGKYLEESGKGAKDECKGHFAKTLSDLMVDHKFKIARDGEDKND